MLNAYPDSIGQNLGNLIKWLQNPALKEIFQSFYILPSMFNSDLDRGFSVIDYNLNEVLAKKDDLTKLNNLGIALKLDFVINHASVQSKQFQDILANGENSIYKDFFIDWNQFWAGCGSKTEAGYINPEPKYLEKMHFRKPGLPLLMVPMPDGTKKPYWNTFYQSCSLGQMDLNINSPLVWEFYDETLQKLSSYGAEIVRLDAFAYAPKEPGAGNFLNDPGTWELLSKIRTLADKYSLQLLPEIHAEYREKIHEKLTLEGYITYDFFLPGLLIHALEKHTCTYLLNWINDIRQKNIKTVNMLGCHDGIPVLDLRGLLPEEEIEDIIKIIVGRGGHVKDVQGNKKMYYQVNATYFSALGEQQNKMLLARAIQIFMPGIPQVWYLDLVGGKNDYTAVQQAGENGHKEINRTNLSLDHMENALNDELTVKQLELLRFRNTNPAFGSGAKLSVIGKEHKFSLQWENNGNIARLDADLKSCTYEISNFSL
ncbi:MAG: alpha-amylase family glycosyl hydrolase [Defluviitaleaceae bacterium]|nr:alpha-amylase family glycosyl hydrolase [Defluviitaleaceae bacterium]